MPIVISDEERDQIARLYEEGRTITEVASMTGRDRSTVRKIVRAADLYLVDEKPAAKVLIYDIETAPNLGYVWQRWQTDVIEMASEWYMLSFAYKWLGDPVTHVVALPDFALYQEDPTNDRELVKVLRDLFDEADVTVTHNGHDFDRKKAQARMFVHGLETPSSYKEVDTLKVARHEFSFSSNRLGDLVNQLGIEHKGDPGGFKTWLGCMNGDDTAWARMKKYNRKDVVITEALYLKMLPWIQGHPNLAILNNDMGACPRCGKGPLVAAGYKLYQVSRRREYRCENCGGLCLGRKLELTTTQYVAA